MAETQEIMRRTWHIEARSVRPDHRMVGHTGFLTTARRLADAELTLAQSLSMKMHSPGHSSEASTTASSRSAGTAAMPAEPPGSFMHGAVFLHVGEAVVEKGEHGRRDLLAQAVARAEILVDPDLHVVVSLLGRCALRRSTLVANAAPDPPVTGLFCGHEDRE